VPSARGPEMRDLFYDNHVKGWAPGLVKRRLDITMEQIEKFPTRMYRTSPDFVFTVMRDFVYNCRTPILILPHQPKAARTAKALDLTAPSTPIPRADEVIE
jgi:hypothetical protein